MTEIRFFIAALAAALCSLGVKADVGGVWHGFIPNGNQKLPIVFDLDKSTMDSPSQNVFGIPVDAKISGDSLSVDVPAIGLEYSGVRAGDVIDGSFSQRGFKFALRLEKGPYIARRPQTPLPPFPYMTEEVEIVNPVDSAVLSGTLTVPLMANIVGRGKLPVAVIVSGSGLQNRDGEVFNHKPYLVLAHNLANMGIATLRCDDRGYGKSTGKVDDATTATFASDAAAAIDYLRRLDSPFRSVGVIGHSEGGTIAFMLASEGTVDFAVSLAGTAVSGDSILQSQNELILKGLNVPDAVVEDYIKGMSRVFTAMKAEGHCDVAAAVADLPALGPEMAKNLSAIVDGWNPWIDNFVRFDPSQSVAGAKCPVMALNGSLDMQVEPKLNLGAIRRNLPANRLSLIKEYPGLNHMFQHARSGSPEEYSEIEETMSAEVMADIAAWIKSVCDANSH